MERVSTSFFIIIFFLDLKTNSGDFTIAMHAARA